jgi:hypothetical protein
MAAAELRRVQSSMILLRFTAAAVAVASALVPGRAHPDVALVIGGQDRQRRLGVDRLDHGTGLATASSACQRILDCPKQLR